MSYCLNLACPRPENPDPARYCQACGATLRLRDRYLPLRLLGQGGFGRTVLAWDQPAEAAEGAARLCVVKQLWPTRDRPTPAPAPALAQEAQRLQELGQHPQIPELWDYFTVGAQAYLIQAFVDGENLAQHLARQGVWSEAQVRSLLLSLLPVLAFIHAAQVIHRDIKPENIIIAGDSQQFFLVDFGAAKQITPQAAGQAGTVIGSAAYAAPEQTLGHAAAASDLYSLGVTCLHLLTGEHPFDLYSIADDRWLWQPYLAQPLSSRLTYVLNKMTRRARRQRYDAATAVLADLARPRQSPKIAPQRRSPRIPTQWFTALTHRLQPAATPALVTPQTWQLIWQQVEQTAAITSLALHPHTSALLTGHLDGSLREWQLETGELVCTWPAPRPGRRAAHPDQVQGVFVVPDGQTVISASRDGTILIWDWATQQVRWTLPGVGWQLTAIALDQGGTLLVSGTGEGQVTLWDWQTGQILRQVQPHRDRIISLAVAIAQPWVLSSSTDAVIQVWDGRTGARIKALSAHQERVTALAVSPQGEYAISTSADGTVKTWLLPSLQLAQTFAKHGDRVVSVTISPMADWVATGSEDGQVFVWHPLTGAVLDQLPHGWAMGAIAAGPQHRLITTSQDETLRLWQGPQPPASPLD